MFYSRQNQSLNSGYNLLPQAIPTKDKDQYWLEGNMDILENLGMRQIADNQARFSDTKRIMTGDYSYKEISNSSLFLSDIDFWRSQTDAPQKLEHYGFIEPIVNSLVHMFSKRPNPFLIDATDSLSTNDYIREKTDRLWNSITQQLEERIQRKAVEKGLLPEPEFESEEQAQQYQQQLDQLRQTETPAEIEKDMNTNYKAEYVKWAEATMEEDYTRFDMDEIDRDCQYDYMEMGKCYKHYRVGYDFYKPERWQVIDEDGGGTFGDPNVVSVEDGSYGGRIIYQSHSDVIANYGHLMSALDKELLTKSKGYKVVKKRRNPANGLMELARKGGGSVHQVPNPSFFEFQNVDYIQNATGIDFGFTGYFPNSSSFRGGIDNFDRLRVTEAYWKGFQRVGYLTVPNPEGDEPISEVVTDEILKEYLKENEIKQLKTVSLSEQIIKKEVNTIVWDYLPVVYKGVKISKENTDLEDDLYLGVEQLPYQLKGDSENYHRKLPLTGINEKTSFISRLQDYQVNYSLSINAAVDIMKKDWGTFFLFDSAYLPDHLKGDEDALIKMREMAIGAGFLEIDGSRAKSAFNQFSAVNMDMSAAAISKLQMARMFKQEAMESVGLTEQIMGTPSSVETATGVDQQVKAAHSKIDIWFDKFDKFKKRSAEVHLNVAQFAKKEGIDGTVKFTDSDRVIKILNLDDPYLTLRNFRISMENNSKRRSELEMMKQYFLQDNTIVKDLESIAEVASADSIVKVKLAGRYARKLAEIQTEKQQAAEQQQVETQQKGLAERQQIDLAWEAKEADLDRQMQILKTQISTLGWQEDKDMNKNGISDVIETGKLALEQLKYSTASNYKALEMDNLRLDKLNDQNNKQTEFQLKREEIAAKKHAADMQYKSAIENTSKSEIEAKRKANIKK